MDEKNIQGTNTETIENISDNNSTLVDKPEYFDNIDECFSNLPDVAQPLVYNAKTILNKIEKMLYSAPAFIEVVKASIPEQAFQAILTGEQKRKLANGALELMTKKDGSLMANLVDPKTKKIASTVSLEKVNLTPNISQAMTNYATNVQMAQIAEQIQDVQIAIEEVRQGQEYDRLATAYSCQQKFLQATVITNAELKTMTLLRIAADAEDSRNLLMLSQNANVEFIKNEPESLIKKLLAGSSKDKIDSRISEIRDSLYAVNMVSLVEAIAYQEIGENEAARKSLEYYASYIQKTYLDTEGFAERLDLIDSSPKPYWTKTLPEIKSKIKKLPNASEVLLLGDESNGTKSM